MNDVNRIIFELIHSNDNNDKLGGILAIGKDFISFQKEKLTLK